VGPSRIQLDPQKEASADLIDLNMRVKTRKQIIQERTGGSFEAKHAQLVTEKKLGDAAGFVTAASSSEALQPPPPKKQNAAEDDTEDTEDETQ
jgi:capsid protein